MNPLRRLIPPAIVLLILTAFGTLGYVVMEKTSFLDALYMLVITLSTVGYREVVELSPYGKILTIVLILAGVGTLFYTIGQLVEIMVEGQIIGFRRRKKMEKRISELKNHYIICGFGRVGQQVEADLKNEKIPYVVVDSNVESMEKLASKSIPYLIGNITSEETLTSAGIKRAKGIIAAADSDADNVLVALSARTMNPNIHIIARASHQAMEEKLKLAGANRVITPYYIAGRRMAAMAMKPVVIDYLDTVSHSEHLQLGIREFSLGEKSKMIGKDLSNTEIRQKSGATILAIRKSDGAFNLQPMGNTKIENGDILITLGSTEQLELLDNMVK